jgi:hypothetical protein
MQGTARQNSQSVSFYNAVTLMKQAVESSLQHGDIAPNTVRRGRRGSHAARRAPDTRRSSPQICKAVGMSKSQLTAWLSSRRAGALAARGERLHRLS